MLACRIRVPYPFQWGAPSFDAGEAFAMMMAAFVALVEVRSYPTFSYFCVPPSDCVCWKDPYEIEDVRDTTLNLLATVKLDVANFVT